MRQRRTGMPPGGALRHFSRPNSTASGIAPGLVDTKMTKVTTENPKRLEGDMAGAALFLVSPLASCLLGRPLWSMAA
jgi:hypothetical protein